MKKVLIAIDYHPTSEKIAKAGHWLAQQLGAQVCLIHVRAELGYYTTDYPDFMGFEGFGMATDFDLASEIQERGKEFLNSAANHLKDPSVQTHLGDGDAANEILSYADEWDADLIVMGTHSHSTLEKLFVGSVAAEVLEKTKIPVHMVPVKK